MYVCMLCMLIKVR